MRTAYLILRSRKTGYEKEARLCAIVTSKADERKITKQIREEGDTPYVREIEIGKVYDFTPFKVNVDFLYLQ